MRVCARVCVCMHMRVCVCMRGHACVCVCGGACEACCQHTHVCNTTLQPCSPGWLEVYSTYLSSSWKLQPLTVSLLPPTLVNGSLLSVSTGLVFRKQRGGAIDHTVIVFCIFLPDYFTSCNTLKLHYTVASGRVSLFLWLNNNPCIHKIKHREKYW